MAWQFTDESGTASIEATVAISKEQDGYNAGNATVGDDKDIKYVEFTLADDSSLEQVLARSPDGFCRETCSERKGAVSHISAKRLLSFISSIA